MPHRILAFLAALLLTGCPADAPSDDDDAADDDAADDDAADDDTGDDDTGDDDTGDDDTGDDDTGDDDTTPWQPPPNTSWQIQFVDTPIDQGVDAEAFDIDLFDTPQATINDLHAAGRKVICYFSAGSWEDWRWDAKLFPPESLGNELDGWPGERWLDVTHPTVRELMKGRLDEAVLKQCDAVDPDNVDGYTNNPGFNFQYPEQLDYNLFLAQEAHARGLSIGLKNDLDQIGDLVDHFDFAVNEECFDYEECELLQPFLDQDKAVFQIQYGPAGIADSICPQANAANLDTLIKHMDLDAWRIRCREH